MTSPLTIVLSAKAHTRYWTRIAAVAPHAVARVLPSGDERMTDLDAIDVIWSTNDMCQDGLIRKLSAKPSEIVRRQFRTAPYPHEDAGWIVHNSGDEVCMFSSDYPQCDGGRRPVKALGDAWVGGATGNAGECYAQY